MHTQRAPTVPGPARDHLHCAGRFSGWQLAQNASQEAEAALNYYSVCNTHVPIDDVIALKRLYRFLGFWLFTWERYGIY